MSAAEAYFRSLCNSRASCDVGRFRGSVQALWLSAIPPQDLVATFLLAARATPVMDADTHRKLNFSIAKTFLFMAEQSREFMARLAPHITTLDAHSLQQVLHSHFLLQTVPNSETKALWVEHSIKKAKKMSVEDCVTSIEYLSKLGIHPGEKWVDAWWGQFQKHREGMSYNSLISTLYQLARLDFDAHGKLKFDSGVSPYKQRATELYAYLAEGRVVACLDGKTSNQLRSAKMWLKIGKESPASVLPTDDKSSALEKAFLKSMRGLHIVVDEDGIDIPSLGKRVDLRVLYHGAVLGCEVDGLSHFNFTLAEGNREGRVVYNPQTQFQSWLTSQALPSVKLLHLPFFLRDKKSGDVQLPWNRIFDGLEGKSPNSYVLHGGGKVRPLSEHNGWALRDIQI